MCTVPQPNVQNTCTSITFVHFFLFEMKCAFKVYNPAFSQKRKRKKRRCVVQLHRVLNFLMTLSLIIRINYKLYPIILSKIYSSIVISISFVFKKKISISFNFILRILSFIQFNSPIHFHWRIAIKCHKTL